MDERKPGAITDEEKARIDRAMAELFFPPPNVGPFFVGKIVDGIVAVMPQIDEAKRQLDKRFYPRSDVLRDNKD